jgi:chromosome transmission fidelity protein 1
VLTFRAQVSGYTAVAVAQATGSVELQQSRDKQHHKQKQQAPATLIATSTAAAGSATSTEADGSRSEQQQQQQLGQLSPRDGVSAIHSFIAFLLSLTNTDADGRVIIEPAAAAAAVAALPPTPSGSTGDQEPSAAAQAARGGRMRYVLLNAARHFGRLLSSARSVLLVSGTLAPIDGLRAQLFPDLHPERLRHFECGHVVPADHLLAVSIGSGPSGKALNLRHDSRGDNALIDELGQLLLNLACVVPEGLVVFAPSFGYLEQLLARWQGSGLLARLQQRKQLFR